ncbi:MAG: tetratricopeptide repeat protein [Solirubrobacterales bacterium]|nr:tetratricopeptide repeat protein [Solirubrobacterales bacterium]
MVLEIRVLGPVEAVRDGRPVAVGGPRQQATLLVLALNAGHSVTAEQLVDAIWGENPPAAAVKTARAYVSRLRAALGDGAITSDRWGYLLGTDGTVVDAERFAELVRSGQAAIARDAPARAERELASALSLWRSSTVGQGADVERIDAATGRLGELRLTAAELRLDSLITLDRHAEAIAAAEELLATEPFREGVWARLMLALYLADRQANALEAFQRARRVLVEELGLEPGPALTAMHERILRQEIPIPAAGEAGNLPVPVTSFIGREAELVTLAELIADSRLVTLVGVGGAGKTRLAIEAAARWRHEHHAPVWFFDLAPLREPDLILSKLMLALGTSETAGSDPIDIVIARLRDRPALLLLDNCEHMVQACASLSVALLDACPRLRVLATSRAPLWIAGETIYTVPPLSAPDARTPRWRPELGVGYDAVQLFLARARAAGGANAAGVSFRAMDLRLVSEICRRLDGLPLAIEFAAARSRTMTLSEVGAALEDRFELLAGGRRVGPERHQTLRAALDWSYELISRDDQRLLQRLSVFAGGFTPAAVAAVCGAGSTELARSGVDRLVDASLVLVDSANETTRYRLYETVREYAAQNLTDPHQRAELHACHARYFAELAKQAADGLGSRDEQQWLQRLDYDQDNLRAALRWAATRSNADCALLASMAVALGPYWQLRGTLDEAVGWLRAALRSVPHGSAVQAAIELRLAAIARTQTSFAEAERLLEHAIATARSEHELELLATGLQRLAGVRKMQSRFAEAIPLAQEARSLWEEIGDPLAASWPIAHLADIAACEGRYSEARELYQAALPIIRDQGPPSRLVAHLHTMAELAFATGELDRAELLCDKALPTAERIGDYRHTGMLHMTLAWTKRARHALEQATHHALLALEHFVHLQETNGIADAIETLAGIALDQHDGPYAALLLTGAAHLRDTTCVPIMMLSLKAITTSDRQRAAKLAGDDLPAIRVHAESLTLAELVQVARHPAKTPKDAVAGLNPTHLTAAGL